jgi:hypothetical protein
VWRHGTQAFCNVNESPSEVSTPTHGGDAFGMELTKNRKFSSSGLNLAFEGLLLGVSLRRRVKGTRNEPRESGFRSTMLSFTQKEHLSSFVGKCSCRRCPGGGNKRPVKGGHRDGACGGQKSEASYRSEVKSQRHMADCRTKITTRTSTRGGALLEHQKVISWCNSLHYLS